MKVILEKKATKLLLDASLRKGSLELSIEHVHLNILPQLMQVGSISIAVVHAPSMVAQLGADKLMHLISDTLHTGQLFSNRKEAENWLSEKEKTPLVAIAKI